MTKRSNLAIDTESYRRALARLLSPGHFYVGRHMDGLRFNVFGRLFLIRREAQLGHVSLLTLVAWLSLRCPFGA